MYEQSITTNHTSTYICIYLVYFTLFIAVQLNWVNTTGRLNSTHDHINGNKKKLNYDCKKLEFCLSSLNTFGYPL